jgi:hypothetical protein
MPVRLITQKSDIFQASMSESTHLFVWVVLLRTFPYSNSSQICELNMFPKNQCSQILRTHIPFARIYSRTNAYNRKNCVYSSRYETYLYKSKYTNTKYAFKRFELCKPEFAHAWFLLSKTKDILEWNNVKNNRGTFLWGHFPNFYVAT